MKQPDQRPIPFADHRFLVSIGVNVTRPLSSATRSAARASDRSARTPDATSRPAPEAHRASATASEASTRRAVRTVCRRASKSPGVARACCERRQPARRTGLLKQSPPRAAPVPDRPWRSRIDRPESVPGALALEQPQSLFDRLLDQRRVEHVIEQRLDHDVVGVGHRHVGAVGADRPAALVVAAHP